MTDYEWHAPNGETIPLGEHWIEALASIRDVFPGARVVRYREPPYEWREIHRRPSGQD